MRQLLSDEDYRALIESASLLEELTRHPGWAELEAQAHEAMSPIKKHVLNGGPSDIEEYRKKTGWLTGVHMVLEIPELFAKKLHYERESRAEAGEPLT